MARNGIGMDRILCVGTGRVGMGCNEMVWEGTGWDRMGQF